MRRAWQRIANISRSLYARIVFVYLAGLLLLAVAAAWVAVSQFEQLGREWQQRTQIDLADNLVQVMQGPLRAGANSPAARDAADRILSINPAVSLYVLDADGRVAGNYAEGGCSDDARVSVAALEDLLADEPMLPVVVDAPCSHRASVFSVAPVRFGPGDQRGYLLAVLDAGARMSMFAMLRTSSITRTLLIAGSLAVALAGVLGLLLFALLTRRFKRLTAAVERFAVGDYGQRIEPGRADEIGHLSRAFNDMAATIEAQLDALRENDRQRRELVANLSHDFRTPLTSLRGYAEQLRKAEHLPAETRDAHLAAILANADRLTRLARQLSTLARVDAFEKPLCVDAFSLAELIHDIAGKFRAQAQEAGLNLTVDCAPTLPAVAADLALIDRVLANLIDNAIAATPPGGAVTVSARVVDARVEVRIVDSGVGLSADELALVTQRFYRTPASRQRGEGSGLGLSIVEEICARHGTRLRLRSVPGEGTHAAFDLPVA